uniref:Ubiquitin-associated and SH3 domain-containing protein B isoform X1 n=1 Tax=Petromyzon marinus TaxID=7757 RepID=A0AAJ7X405_PETMA|nr:ubiquitin-associated and SH3 domain-containing protein B isoform X1 [Petromyzon marinus]
MAMAGAAGQGDAAEVMYSKVVPKSRRATRQTIKNASSLDILLSMGFPRARALKALASTGDHGVQEACDWLFSHLSDPFLDDPLPREYVLYLCPTGRLAQRLSDFWDASRAQCGKNKAHNVFPHVTLCQFFTCEDENAEGLYRGLKGVVETWRPRFPTPLRLEHFSTPNFLGLFVQDGDAEILREFAAEFAAEVAKTADVKVEPHKRQLHLTLAYQFQAQHLAKLERLVRAVDPELPCEWCAVLYSRDIRYAGHETLRVLYPYIPQNDDELELIPGDSIFVSPSEHGAQGGSEGWVQGTSWISGLAGLLPENYTQKADESDTWVLHRSYALSCPVLTTEAAAAAAATSVPRELLLRHAAHGNGESSSASSSALLAVNGPASATNSQRSLRGGARSGTELARRSLFVLRHGERMDVVFGRQWVAQCFDERGVYFRSNMNMPASLPQRSGGHRQFENDPPLTVLGVTQARLTGEALFDVAAAVDVVYCSPSLRCVQTAQHLLKGLQIEGRLRIKIEPGLFEWTKWTPGNCLPSWMSNQEFTAAGIHIDTTYRPLIPVAQLNPSESYDVYVTRSFHVCREILADCKQKAGLSRVLMVGHASSLDACTRQLRGLSKLPAKDFIQIVRKVPYLGFCACQELEEAGIWQMVDPPILPLTHGPNPAFCWREALCED